MLLFRVLADYPSSWLIYTGKLWVDTTIHILRLGFQYQMIKGVIIQSINVKYRDIFISPLPADDLSRSQQGSLREFTFVS